MLESSYNNSIITHIVLACMKMCVYSLFFISTPRTTPSAFITAPKGLKLQTHCDLKIYCAGLRNEKDGMIRVGQSMRLTA